MTEEEANQILKASMYLEGINAEENKNSKKATQLLGAVIKIVEKLGDQYAQAHPEWNPKKEDLWTHLRDEE